MKVGEKAIIGSMVFMLACVVGLIFSTSSPLWKSFYFIREHIFVIGLLILISDYIYESLQLTLIYGLILYKIELVVFNIILAFMPSESWIILSKSYNVAIWFTVSIWFILFICLLIKKRL